MKLDFAQSYANESAARTTALMVGQNGYLLHDGCTRRRPARPHDSKEVQAVEWLTPVEAGATLTHDDDRKLVSRVFDIERKLT